jgi:hypothetical protein
MIFVTNGELSKARLIPFVLAWRTHPPGFDFFRWLDLKDWPCLLCIDVEGFSLDREEVFDFDDKLLERPFVGVMRTPVRLAEDIAPVEGHRQKSITSKDANFQLSVVGECKWSENTMGLSVLRELEAKVLAHKLPLAAGCRYVLFCKSGYAPDLEEVAAESKNIVLESVCGVGKG